LDFSNAFRKTVFSAAFIPTNTVTFSVIDTVCGVLIDLNDSIFADIQHFSIQDSY
jgi:hypothetical protein